MLNMFLVLGQVPGTQHQLTFNEILITLLIVAEVFMLRRYRKLFLSYPLISRLKRHNRLPIQLQLFK